MVRDRPFVISLFAISLGVSALFHLSMFTLFSIVILFPREEVRYYELQIQRVPPASRAADPEETGPALEPPSLHDALAEEPRSLTLPDPALDLADGAAPLPPMPSIRLPTLEFAGLERLGLREDSLRIRSRYEGLFDSPRRDSWARFGGELGQLGDALARLPFLERLALEEQDAPPLVSRPAEGFEARIEWMNEPLDRELLFAPPIEALWRLDPAELDEPIILVFRVNPQGRVVEVQLPLEDEAGVIAGAGEALLQYRFEPLDAGADRDQHATLLISPAEAAP